MFFNQFTNFKPMKEYYVTCSGLLQTDFLQNMKEIKYSSRWYKHSKLITLSGAITKSYTILKQQTYTGTSSQYGAE